VGIDPLPGYERSVAWGLNNAGQVVGRFSNVNPATGAPEERRGFLWDPGEGARLLPTLAGESSAWDVNEGGLASGASSDAAGRERAALWDSGTSQLSDLGTLSNPSTGASGPTSTAYGVNKLGGVVGRADIPNNDGSLTPFHAFRADGQSGMQDLGTLTTAWPQYQNGYSIAYAVNAGGAVVGIAHDDALAYVPFIYDSTTGMQPLPRDPVFLSGEWYAVAINDTGLIGGHVIAAPNQSIPFYWPDRASAPLRLPLPAGFPYGEIYGVNSAGQMVGLMWDSDQADATHRAFLFDTQGGVRDLTSLIDPQSGWVLSYARDINDAGQIVGFGQLNGQDRAVVLNPVTVPSVTSVAPTSGPAVGGTAVTLTGTNFVSGASVSFGGTTATNVVVASNTSITATTPAHAAGTVNVVVTNPDGQSGTLTSGFTYTSNQQPGPPPATNSGSGGGGCFIATAAFGSQMAPQVQLLREFRDRYLLPRWVGQLVVGWYYALSPPLAAVIRQSSRLRALVRAGLWPLVGWVALMLWSPALGLGVALLPLVGAGWWVGRRGRRH